jgi:hypothetical protein
MNPPDQPTPRTDAAWSKTFQDELNQFWSGNAANKMRDECARLESELAASNAEAAHYMAVAQKATDELIFFRADSLKAHQMTCAAALERDSLRAEVERWKTVAAEMSQQREHNANEAARERARLDYLALQMGTPRVADALDLDYSLCFPIRDAIDLAMKKESNTP